MGGAGRWQRNAAGNPPQAVPQTRLLSMDYYDQYLKLGLPIATGVIEGACRYLVQDRMDRTGARWSLIGAEAVLRLRALRTSGDFDAYWRFHEQQDYRRNHVALYADGQMPPIRSRAKKHLKGVK